MGKQFREHQYDEFSTLEEEVRVASLGRMRNFDWHNDPRRLLFTLARYKFVSKMFDGYETVLEIGCGDAFATRIVQQTVKKVTATDFDPIFIEEIHDRRQHKWELDAHVHNMVLEPTKQSFDGIFSLDVLEHVQQSDEDAFLKNTCLSLKSHGALIIGMPSLESQTYASEASKIGHVNCKTGTDLRDLMIKYFHSVFMFSMNDEVVHTGFFPMAHYLFAVCCDKKQLAVE